MTCLEVQGLITPFIHKELDKNQIEEFVEHVEHCDSCKEELEVYYILLTSMKQLDADEELSKDFHKEFLALMEKTKAEIVNRKKHIFRKRLCLTLLIGGLAILMSLSLGTFEETPKEKITESHFELKYRFLNKRPIFEHSYHGDGKEQEENGQ